MMYIYCGHILYTATWRKRGSDKLSKYLKDFRGNSVKPFELLTLKEFKLIQSNEEYYY